MALGCAGFVAAHPGALVVTAIAGKPGPHPLTDWDRKCGFVQEDDVMGARRLEDEAAIAELGATTRWLDFLDRQYADWKSPDTTKMTAALRPILDHADFVAAPLGIGHPDHVAVAQACFELARSPRGKQWVLYEDVIYRTTDGRTEEAVARLRKDGFALSEVEFLEAPHKRQAIERYKSQVLGLGDLLDDAYRPERYWRLTLT